jgi:carnitine-CoA ligase
MACVPTGFLGDGDALPPMSSTSDFPSRGECVIADLLELRAAERPDRVYAEFPESTWTFAETARRAWQFANGLIREGLTPGDHVSVWTSTGPELIQAWFGTNAAGGVYAPLNLAARGAFLQHAINLVSPRIMVVHPTLIERLIGLELPTLELLVVTGEVPDEDLPWRAVPFERITDGAGIDRPRLEAPREPWDDFAVIYTSGTTGPSKGVRLPYASHLLYSHSFPWDDIGEDDRYLLTLPLFHVAGTSVVYAMLDRGGRVIFSAPFHPKTFWDDVRRYRATSTAVMHGMVPFLLAEPPSAHDRDNPLRVIYMAPLARVDEFRERFDVDVYTAYGMTEVPCPLRSGLNPSGEQAGRPFNDDFELRIVDEHDLPLPHGTPGELVLRHRLPWMINSGYINMPEATVEAWRNGWFHTGDQLVVNEQGDYVFVDRVKDAIRRRGENISSYEVEVEVLSHEDVEEVAAVGVTNPDLDEEVAEQEVKIVVVPVQGRSVDPKALIEYLVPRMPRHMVPRYVEVVSELPRSPSFKIKKAELRQAGVTSYTWDREKAGIKLKRESFA